MASPLASTLALLLLLAPQAAAQTAAPVTTVEPSAYWGAARFFMDALKPLVGVTKVCDPDTKLCPSGARAFRQRERGCEFTPCELLAAPAPTPSTNPRALGSPGWYKRYEFVVPRLRFRDVQRGRDVLRRVDEMLKTRARACNARTRRRKSVARNGEPFFYLGCIDLYLIPDAPMTETTTEWARGYAGRRRNSRENDALALDMLRAALLKSARAPSGDDENATTATPLVVEAEPWTRFAFAARTLATWPPPASHVELLVGLELERLMRATGILADAGAYVSPLLVLPVNASAAGTARDEKTDTDGGAEPFDWDAFGLTSDAQRTRVVRFLESRRLALLNYLASVAFLPVAHHKTLEEGRRAHEMVFSSVAMTVFVTRVPRDFCQRADPRECAPESATTTWMFRSTCHPRGFSKRSNNREARRQREQELERANTTAAPLEREARDHQVAYGCSDGGWVFHRAAAGAAA